MVDYATLTWLYPEMFLIFGATALLLLAAFVRWQPQTWTSLAAPLYVAAGARVAFSEWPQISTGIIGPLHIDSLGQSLRLLALAGGLLFTLMATRGLNRRLPGEFIGLVMLAVAGIMLAARANDLALLFVSLELVSIPSYILLFLGRSGRPAAEATMKYFFLSILSSGLLLYGLSFLYGLGGTLTLSGPESIAAALQAEQNELLLSLALGLTFAGIGFKMAAAPFHFYAPDVYQGASNAVAAFLSVAPKMAGVAALLRLGAAMPEWSGLPWRLVIVLSLATMTIGNVGALWQSNFRRLLAYSSIAHAGYLLIGVAVLLAGARAEVSFTGASAVLLYLAAYLFATLGAFAAAVGLERRGRAVDGVNDLAGLGRTRPATAVALAIMMFSLAGIPPLLGFWGKLTLLTGAVSVAVTTSQSDVQFWFLALALGGAVNAAIAAAYYLRVISAMYFQPPSDEARDSVTATVANPANWTLGICGVAVVLLGVMPTRLLTLAGDAGWPAAPAADVVEVGPAPAPLQTADADRRSPPAR